MSQAFKKSQPGFRRHFGKKLWGKKGKGKQNVDELNTIEDATDQKCKNVYTPYYLCYDLFNFDIHTYLSISSGFC